MTSSSQIFEIAVIRTNYNEVMREINLLEDSGNELLQVQGVFNGGLEHAFVTKPVSNKVFVQRKIPLAGSSSQAATGFIIGENRDPLAVDRPQTFLGDIVVQGLTGFDCLEHHQGPPQGECADG